MLSDQAIAFIRTAVPAGVGVVLAWVAAHTGIVIDESSQAGLVALVAGVLTATWWTLVTLLSKKWPAAGWLLGSPKKPVYVEPVKPPQQAPA